MKADQLGELEKMGFRPIHENKLNTRWKFKDILAYLTKDGHYLFFKLYGVELPIMESPKQLQTLIYGVYGVPEDPTKRLQEVSAVQDDSCHWYVIPNDLVSEFYKDSENEDMCDSGEFGNKWDEYRTGGDLNNVQLYAVIESVKEEEEPKDIHKVFNPPYTGAEHNVG